MTNIASIAQLQSDWIGLSDLDRAIAVHTIKLSGISIRKVAAQLQLSESLLRHLLQALQAPAQDRALAMQGAISTNELVRRAKAGLRPTERYEPITVDHDREIRIAADLICDWLLQTNLYGPAREAIVKEVQHKFIAMKEAGRHPSVAAPPRVPVSQIIKRTKPPTLDESRIDIVAWFAQWLCRWSFFAFPDEAVRDPALDFALLKQQGR